LLGQLSIFWVNDGLGHPQQWDSMGCSSKYNAETSHEYLRGNDKEMSDLFSKDIVTEVSPEI